MRDLALPGSRRKLADRRELADHHRDGTSALSLFQKKIAIKNLGAAAIILIGVFLLQLGNIVSFRLESIAQAALANSRRRRCLPARQPEDDGAARRS